MTNPGCLIQISVGLERAGRTITVLHMVELLDASIHGTSREALLRNIHRWYRWLANFCTFT